MKKALILILVLFNMGFNQGAGVKTPNESTEPITGAWLEENLEHITLELYYIDPWVLTRAAWTVDDVKQSCDVRITADAQILKEQKSLLVQMLDTPITALDKQDSHLNARIYYALCDNSGKVLFEVAMWGMEGEIFVNGVSCEEEDVFYDVAIAFLPPDIAPTFQSYLEGDSVFEIPRKVAPGDAGAG